MLRQFEHHLQSTLGLNQLAVVTNGTIALQIAFKAAGLKGKVITTPFSYIATVSNWSFSMHAIQRVGRHGHKIV